MTSNAATPVPAEAERFPRKAKGAVQEVVTCDRLHNRERQSLSQVSQLASKLNLDNPGTVHAINLWPRLARAPPSSSSTGASVRRTTTTKTRERTKMPCGATAAAKPKPKPKLRAELSTVYAVDAGRR